MAETLPKIQNLKDGIIKCPSCSADIPLSSGAPLEVTACPKCSAQVILPLRIRDYWLYTPLGGGGMGSVYKAISEKDDRDYAVKVLPRREKTNKDLIKTILHDGKTGSAIGKHKNVVEITDYGLDGDEYFIVTEFVHGDRLDLLVESKKQIPEKEAVEIALQIIEAEMHIIQAGYLFRDMKPENIIIDKTGTVKLFDYGLCMTLHDASAHENVGDELNGSPFYIPPERIVGAPEGEYSEIYSLGMVLFYMLAGRTYYSLAEVNDLVTKHLTSLRVLSVSSFLKHCNPKIVAIIDRMIARKPVKRYHDFATLKQDMLQHYESLGKETKMRLPPLVPARMQNINFKSKTTIYAAFVAVVILIVLGIWGLSAYNKSAKKREIRKFLIETTASNLGVSKDVKAPALSPEELKKQIDDAARKIAEQKISALPLFNEMETRKLICSNLNLKTDATSPMTVDEASRKMGEEIRSVIEREIGKIDRNFNEQKELERISGELKLEMPLKEPSAPLKTVDAEYKAYLQKKVEEKYSGKNLYSQVSELGRKYGGYKKGDPVELQDAVGLPVKGVYNGKAGNKIVIGDRQILASDIPASMRWKFNEAECEAKVQKMSEQLLDEFKKNKEKYKTEIETSEKPGFYRKYGYSVTADGTCRTSMELVAEIIKKTKANYQEEIKNREKRIRDEAPKKFNKSEYMKKNSFREIDGKWYTASDSVKIYMKAEKDKFDKNRKLETDAINTAAKKEAENQVYPQNGYVLYENKWQPARPLLDAIVDKKLREELK
ncbi:MAG TPA: hypothetical protein DET40_21275 [Lentisphaeria bacterium]|nr:MAG: hypothetical protein A2X45_03185 [Lentisphaerae bacterium GWF2_50_93]HCE46084.1 hypothetical protein [Lentisphaeria bacterium]